MTCEEALVLLSGHLDSRNSDEEKAQLQAHLSQCPSCRQLLAELEELDRKLLSLESEPPEDLCQSVMEAVRTEPMPQKSRPRWVVPAATAAAAAVILLTGVWAVPKFRTTEDAAVELARAVPETAVCETALPAEAAEPETAAVSPKMANAAQEATAETSGAAQEATAGSADRIPEARLFGAEDDLSGAGGTSDSPDQADRLAQAVADQRMAQVVLLYTQLPELEELPCETLEDGSLLYTLEDAGGAEALWSAYPGDAVLYLPETADGAVSYALVLPQEQPGTSCIE